MVVPSTMLEIAIWSLLFDPVAWVNRAPCLPLPHATQRRGQLKQAIVSWTVTFVSRTGTWPWRSSTRPSPKS